MNYNEEQNKNLNLTEIFSKLENSSANVITHEIG